MIFGKKMSSVSNAVWPCFAWSIIRSVAGLMREDMFLEGRKKEVGSSCHTPFDVLNEEEQPKK